MRSLHSLRRMSGTVLALMLAAGLPLSAAQAQPAKPAPKGDQKPATPAPSEQFVDGIAAIVNKDVITLREVREASKLASADLQKRGIQVPDERTLQKQVLQRLIMERLERQEADRMGIRVDEAQVDQAINMIASRNKITPAAMRAEIEKSGVTWEQYRKSLRDDIRMDRLRQRAVDANIIISDAEVDAFLKDQERNPAAAQATRAPAPQQPHPQPRQPTHDQARQRLEQIRERLQGGAVKFEDMARQYSQDSTAPQGGDLGWVNPGDTVPPFEAAMNALQPNEISPPMLSPFGWHLIQVLERREHDVSDEVQRMRARQLLFERRAVPAFEDWLEQLRSQAFIDNRLEKQERLEQNNR